MLQITPYTLRLLLQYINTMREAQRMYFKGKSQLALVEAKKYEGKVDRLVALLWPLAEKWDGTWEELVVEENVYREAVDTPGLLP